MPCKSIFFSFLTIFFISTSGAASGIDRSGIICFEMGADVAYYFIKGKVIRYSAFHAFNPPTELQKQLYGKYIVEGENVKWRDAKTKVRFSFDNKLKKLAANEKWSTASPCEDATLKEIKDHFQPILERNRSSVGKGP